MTQPNATAPSFIPQIRLQSQDKPQVSPSAPVETPTTISGPTTFSRIIIAPLLKQQNDLITFQVSSTRFHLLHSALLATSTRYQHWCGADPNSLGPELIHLTMDDAIIWRYDPDIFRHVATYIETKRFPLFYTGGGGFDEGMYAAVLMAAAAFGVLELTRWIGERRFEKAVGVTFEVKLLQGHERKNIARHTDHQQDEVEIKGMGDGLLVVKKRTRIDYGVLGHHTGSR